MDANKCIFCGHLKISEGKLVVLLAILCSSKLKMLVSRVKEKVEVATHAVKSRFE